MLYLSTVARAKRIIQVHISNQGKEFGHISRRIGDSLTYSVRYSLIHIDVTDLDAHLAHLVCDRYMFYLSTLTLVKRTIQVHISNQDKQFGHISRRIGHSLSYRYPMPYSLIHLDVIDIYAHFAQLICDKYMVYLSTLARAKRIIQVHISNQGK